MMTWNLQNRFPYTLKQFSFCTYLMSIWLTSFLASCHKTPAYCHDSSLGGGNFSNWMKNLHDDRTVSSLSLPGTHETLSKGYGGVITHCQTLDLPIQLNAGIRALDIRCRHVDNAFAIHHGAVFQHLWFGEVLRMIQKFLGENPSETIFMRVKQEYHPVNNTRDFKETFKEYQRIFHDLFWHGTPCTKTTLGSIRGKIVVLDDFSDSSDYGFNYRNQNMFLIQDHYVLTSNWDLYPKWERIKKHLQNAQNSRPISDSIFINYLSGSTGVFPFFVSSGHISAGTGAPRLATGFTTLTSKSLYPDFPRVACALGICSIAFEGTNVLTWELLQKNPEYSYVGIIMADFPGQGLISSIIDVNSRPPRLGDMIACPKLWTLEIVILSFAVFILVIVMVVASRALFHYLRKDLFTLQQSRKIFPLKNDKYVILNPNNL